MKPTIEYKLGDCLKILPNYAPQHFTAACFSPPYGVGEYFDIRRDFAGPTAKFLVYLRAIADACRVVAVNFGQLSHPDRTLSTFTEQLVLSAAERGIHLLDRWMIVKPSCNPRRGVRVLNPMEFVLLFSKLPPASIAASNPEQFKTVIPVKGKQNYSRQFSDSNLGTTPYFMEIPHQVFSVYGGEGPVLDPFCGSGTSMVAAQKLGLSGVGIDVSEAILSIASLRTNSNHPLL